MELEKMILIGVIVVILLLVVVIVLLSKDGIKKRIQKKREQKLALEQEQNEKRGIPAEWVRDL